MRNIVIAFGAALMGLSILALLGWYSFDWHFVDPFFATLTFIASPFFVVMGIANPRSAEEQSAGASVVTRQNNALN